MVQIIEENRQPSFLQSILGGFAQGVQPAMKQYMEFNQSQQKNKLSQQMAIQQQQADLEKALQIENLKQSGKEKRTTSQQEFLHKLLNKTTSPDQEDSADNSGIGIGELAEEDIIEAENMGIKGLREAQKAVISKREGETKEQRRQFESDRDYHTKISRPIVEEATNVVRAAPISQGLIDQQRRDIATGDTSGILPFLTDKLGLENYRNPASARFRTASKERFVENLHSLGGAGARPNQFIEQQLVAAQAGLGRSEEANETVLDLEEFINDMKLQRAKYELEEAEKDREKYTYERGDIALRADKRMKDYSEKRQEKMAFDIRKRHEDNLPDEALVKEISLGQIPFDTPITPRMANILMIKNNDNEKAAIAEARRLGFRLTTQDLE